LMICGKLMPIKSGVIQGEVDELQRIHLSAHPAWEWVEAQVKKAPVSEPEPAPAPRKRGRPRKKRPIIEE
jgi:hypothetical protein